MKEILTTIELDDAVRKVFKCPNLTNKESAQVVLRHPWLVEVYREEIKIRPIKRRLSCLP